ncbi:hypothetical protein [Ornithinibacillus halotolerans]|uniref:Uncharacterized protein n=1 Tax=Ornithinibacillus halotolerans TaxID=1274357 RepID=A0A916RX09_9BACI|nr:hypothetical protein [Ornithinibacillus halotolerans]GGA74452.1 hypothetical protein GCM10008025_17740 [Ornithinibacillus halotolerans]
MATNKGKFTELNVEKLNIVDKDGTIKMTLFNKENIPPLIMDGKDILPGHRQSDPISGIMFYNGIGEECGGLIFGSEVDEEGNVFTGGSLTFDQYKQDQVVQMHFSEDKGESVYGFSIYDRPKVSLSQLVEKQATIEKSNLSEEVKSEEIDKLYEGNAQRAFMGKDKEGNVKVQLMDSKGTPRIRMVVDNNDVPRMEFLNEKGEVMYKLPPEN